MTHVRILFSLLDVQSFGKKLSFLIIVPARFQTRIKMRQLYYCDYVIVQQWEIVVMIRNNLFTRHTLRKQTLLLGVTIVRIWLSKNPESLVRKYDIYLLQEYV